MCTFLINWICLGSLRQLWKIENQIIVINMGLPKLWTLWLVLTNFATQNPLPWFQPLINLINILHFFRFRLYKALGLIICFRTPLTWKVKFSGDNPGRIMLVPALQSSKMLHFKVSTKPSCIQHNNCYDETVEQA